MRRQQLPWRRRTEGDSPSAATLGRRRRRWRERPWPRRAAPASSRVFADPVAVIRQAPSPPEELIGMDGRSGGGGGVVPAVTFQWVAFRVVLVQ